MERILVILFTIFFAVSAHAAQPSNAPQVLLGVTVAQPSGMATIPVSMLNGSNDVFTIYCGPGTANTSGNVMPCRLNGQIYKVGGNTGGGSSKQAFCFSIRSGSGTAGSLWQWMSGTASYADNTAVGSVTGIKYQGGSSTNYQYETGAPPKFPFATPEQNRL